MIGEQERREAEAAEIDEELARVCGTINAATARQVELIARALENGSYAVAGVRSAEHWVSWQSGVSAPRPLASGYGPPPGRAAPRPRPPSPVNCRKTRWR